MNEDDITRRRDAALQKILTDPADHKVVVAGPGTGKTHTYRSLLGQIGGPALALTFLTVLVRDLEESLAGQADVRSFHGLAKWLLHSNDVEGISRRFHYYPPLNRLLEHDLTLIDAPTAWREIEAALMSLDEDSPIIDGVLRSGNYYDAVGHTDAVYRVLVHVVHNPKAVPRYSQIVVDEYQDFSHLEVRVIEELARQSPTLVVGDDDQALYGFKHANASFLRSLAADGSGFKRFELPYCSRCTAVLVDATNHVVQVAVARDLLQSRIDKPYLCFLPSKKADSERHPRIIHAQCTVQTSRAPLMARYVQRRISEVAEEDIQASREDGHPTVLIIGPTQFTRPVYQHLVEEGVPNVEMKVSAEPTVEAFDGYQLLATDRRSRLGWRILLHCHGPRGWQDWVRAALLDEQELEDLISADYKAAQLKIVRIMEDLIAGSDPSADDAATIMRAVAASLDEIRSRLHLDPEGSDPEGVESPIGTGLVDHTRPTVLVTSLLGAKGLQAEHVFVVGLNDGHFPRHNSKPTDDEVCRLIVALTRARKSCTLVSCGRFGAEELGPSEFVAWLDPFLGTIKVNAAFFQS